MHYYIYILTYLSIIDFRSLSRIIPVILSNSTSFLTIIVVGTDLIPYFNVISASLSTSASITVISEYSDIFSYKELHLSFKSVDHFEFAFCLEH